MVEVQSRYPLFTIFTVCGVLLLSSTATVTGVVPLSEPSKVIVAPEGEEIKLKFPERARPEIGDCTGVDRLPMVFLSDSSGIFVTSDVGAEVIVVSGVGVTEVIGLGPGTIMGERVVTEVTSAVGVVVGSFVPGI